MLVEMRTYSLRPGCLGQWLSLYESQGLPIHKSILGNLLGYFYAETGDINEIVHLWGYESFEDRRQRRVTLSQSEDWQTFLKQALPLLQSQNIKLMNCANFSPIK